MSDPLRDSLIEAIAAGIAHEVRNPLNALQLNVRILEQELAELVPDRQKHVYAVLGKVGQELASLERFVTEFLRYARPPRIEIEAVHVRPLLADLATFVIPECERKGVTLALSIERGPPVVHADGFQLKHAVLNLVLNALQATPSGGRIEMETDLGVEQQLSIAVRDNGDGMTAETLGHVFDVFFTTREGGTGLGLPIARRIVEEHGGTLAISSEPGKGTEAVARIPVGARNP